VSATPGRGRLALDDEQLVALAKSLPPPDFADARREEMRTAFLSTVHGVKSGARGRASAGRGRRRRLLLIGAVLFAGAAAAAAWRIGGLASSQAGLSPKPTALADSAARRPPAAPIENGPAAVQLVQREPEAIGPRPRPRKTALVGHRGDADREAETDAGSAFARGWTALRAGDFQAAAEAFDRAAVARDSQLAEDAYFWRGVALDRAGRFAAASQALTVFLARYPDSDRRGEASVILGWLLVHAGQPQQAHELFSAAVGDPAERVRGSARAGLDATAAPPPP